MVTTQERDGACIVPTVFKSRFKKYRVRELAMARWGMPTPPKLLEGKKTDNGVTNVRNVSSPHWRRWLATGIRCIVPSTASRKIGHSWGASVAVALAFRHADVVSVSVRLLLPGEV
jgi:hypothetical protein